MADVGNTVVVRWDGQRIGCLRVTERELRPAVTVADGEVIAPPTVALRGPFLPEPGFEECGCFFEERVRCEQRYDEAPCGDELAAAFDAMEASIRTILAHLSLPEVDGWLCDFAIDEGQASVRYAPGVEAGPNKRWPRVTADLGDTGPTVPAHLTEWAVPTRSQGDELEAALRCPCGCTRLEFHYPGQTHLHTTTGAPIPCTAELRQPGQPSRFVFAIRAVCTACDREQVVFDSDLHGWTVVINGPGYATTLAALPRPRMWPWRCLDCGSAAHEGTVGFFFEELAEFLDRTDGDLPAARRCDAFTSIGMDIRCCACGLATPGWVGYEVR